MRCCGRLMFLIALLVIPHQSTLRAQIIDSIPPPIQGGFVLSTTRAGNTHYTVLGEEEYPLSSTYRPTLFRSIDDGGSWTKLELPVSRVSYMSRIRSDNDNNLYYLDGIGVYKSTDGGAQWSDVSLALDASGSFLDLETDAYGRVYLLSLKLGLLTSTDHGEQWNSCTMPPRGKPEAAYTQFTCVGDKLYFWWKRQGSSDTLFRSQDYGATWEAFLIGRNAYSVIDGGNGRLLVSQLMMESGTVPFRILSTADDGGTWDTLYTAESIAGFVEWAVDRVFFARSQQGYLAHTYHDLAGGLHILVSSDDGATWRSMSNDAFTYYSGLTFGAGGQLLVYGGDFGFLRYDSLQGEPDRIGFEPVALNWPPAVTDDGSVYALSEVRSFSQMFYWSPSSQSWMNMHGILNPSGGVLRPSALFFPAGGDTLYAGHNGFSRTTDFGRNWEAVLPTSNVHYGNTSQANGRWFAVDTDSIHISSDDGKNWTAETLGMMAPNGMATENDGTSFYLTGFETRLYRKDRDTQKWKAYTIPWFAEALVTGMEQTLFLVRMGGGGIARSSNGGESWQLLPNEFGIANDVRACVRDTLIVLDTSRGLAISADRGDTWTWYDLSSVQPRSMTLRNGSVYVGTQRRGILRIALSSMLSPVTLLQPLNDIACQPLETVLTWTASSRNSPFRVRCSTTPTFDVGTILVDTLIVEDSIRIDGLAEGTMHYWDVAVETGSAALLRSPAWRFRTAVVPSVDIAAPTASDRCVDSVDTFVWNEGECVLYSEIEVSRDPSFTSIEVSRRIDGAAGSASIILNHGTDYYTRIRSTSPAGSGPWSTIVPFHTIDNILVAPAQMYPPDGSVFQTRTTIGWMRHSCVDRYEVLVSRSADFTTDTVAHVLRNGPDTTLSMYGDRWLNGRYYWKLRAIRGAVPGYWSPTWSFVLDVPVVVDPIATPGEFRIVSVYPQPAGKNDTRIMIECTGEQARIVSVDVFDATGRRIRHIPLSATVTGAQLLQLDVASLPTGRYVLLLQGESARRSAPLIITR